MNGFDRMAQAAQDRGDIVAAWHLRLESAYYEQHAAWVRSMEPIFSVAWSGASAVASQREDGK